MVSNLLKHGIYWGYNPLMLTFDTSTSWDIQVVQTNPRAPFQIRLLPLLSATKG